MNHNPLGLLKKFGKGKFNARDKGLFTEILKKLKLNDALVLWHVATHPKDAAKLFSSGEMALIIGAVAYVIMPADAIPDWLPVVGYLDDATVVSYIVSKFADLLARYKKKFM
jgi:uncharacterized membrane protein YkvA (DUF1232 family)